uniref:Uncharacterized protein n=1 Tax=Setaria viridis TaxID=4556 RepID=A0A4U6UDM9_SETVI|nr:hypothetical protein SEVIR_6G031950v2 [Setaria viridis]
MRRRAAREEPDLWHRVDLRGRIALASPVGALKAMAYAAVRRGTGRCEAFWVKGVRDDSFVFFVHVCTCATIVVLEIDLVA